MTTDLLTTRPLLPPAPSPAEEALRLPVGTAVVAVYRAGPYAIHDVLIRTGTDGWVTTLRWAGRDAAEYLDSRDAMRWVDYHHEAGFALQVLGVDEFGES